MNTYTATASNGVTVSRNSERAYTHAVLLINATGNVLATWTSRREIAIKKAESNQAWLTANKIDAKIEIVEVVA